MQLGKAPEDAQTRWRTVAVDPLKWACSPWGDQGGGFWVVAINDDSVIWYNDIEDGFEVSGYTELDRIENYASSQLELSMIFRGGLVWR